MRPPLTLARTAGTGRAGAVALAAMAIALASGSVGVAFRMVRSLMGNGKRKAPPSFATRLPRALAAFSVGGLLAIAGALMQVLLRNALADPYVLEFPAARRSARWAHW